MDLHLGGRENDLRYKVTPIIQIVYDNSIISCTMSSVEAKFTDAMWIKKYPEAREIYRIYGDSPTCYFDKVKIK